MNQKVQLLETQAVGKQIVIATVYCKAGIISCDSVHTLDWFTRDGIAGLDGKRYYPKDGAAFLENLSVAFSGSMFRATPPVAA